MNEIINYLIALYFGMVAGNFATSFYFRIPRGMKLFGLNFYEICPRCSICKHELKFKEFCPIVGYILSKGKCKYCGVSIDNTYLFIELFSVFLSLALYYKFYFFDWYLIFMLLGLSSLVASFLLNKYGEVDKKIIIFIIFWALIYSTLINFEIYNWLLKIGILLIIYASGKNFFRFSKFGIKFHKELLKLFLVVFFWCDAKVILVLSSLILISYVLRFFYRFRLGGILYDNGYLITFFVIVIDHLIKV